MLKNIMIMIADIFKEYIREDRRKEFHFDINMDSLYLYRRIRRYTNGIEHYDKTIIYNIRYVNDRLYPEFIMPAYVSKTFYSNTHEVSLYYLTFNDMLTEMEKIINEINDVCDLNDLDAIRSYIELRLMSLYN